MPTSRRARDGGWCAADRHRSAASGAERTKRTADASPVNVQEGVELSEVGVEDAQGPFQWRLVRRPWYPRSRWSAGRAAVARPE